MKKTKFALFIFSLLFNCALGQERQFSGDEYAIQQHNKDKKEMIENGILSFVDAENLEKKGNQIMSDFEEAFHEEDEEKIKECQKELNLYLTKWECLEQKLVQTKKRNTQPPIR